VYGFFTHYIGFLGVVSSHGVFLAHVIGASVVFCMLQVSTITTFNNNVLFHAHSCHVTASHNSTAILTVKYLTEFYKNYQQFYRTVKCGG
jgi:hypothetical protein